MRRAALSGMLFAACASAPPLPPAAAAHPDVAPFRWMIGRFVAEGGAEERWVPAGDVLVGVGWRADAASTREWEVMLLRGGEAPALIAMPGGRAPTAFGLVARTERSATFANPAHDAPKRIAYRRADEALVAEVDGQALPPMMAKELTDAPALLEADRRFAAEVGARGLDAWREAFADGAMGTPTGPIEGEAIAEAMRATLAPGRRLEWAPLASGLSPAGDLGFTVGEYVHREGATELGRGAYVTIWARGPDGRFRVRFDVGDPARRGDPGRESRDPCPGPVTRTRDP